MRIDTFKIEEWMNRYCPSAKCDLTTSCINPLSIRDLMALCGCDKPLEIFQTNLTYGDIYGSDRLKNAIKSLYLNKKLQNISKNSQVLCITHLPQVASLADNHLKISKEINDNRTNTKILVLNKEQRINEIASMISNNNISEASLKYAEELLNNQ